MKILIVDDHPLVRKGLSLTLSIAEDIDEVQEASNVAEAVNLLTEDEYEIAIIDLKLGKEDGLEIVKSAKNKNLKTKYIILTSSLQKEDFLKSKQAGVHGYLLKDAFSEDILFALQMIQRGKKYFDTEILEYSIREEADQLEQLTLREKDVLIELGKGLSNEEIAQTLFISEHTVKKHVSSILAKLELAHRTQAALLANNLSRG
jgi:DNA-binding NarL/FixJ family response regulator